MKIKVRLLTLGILILITLVFSGFAAASSHLQVDYLFDPGRLEYPEGVIIDKVGNKYVSLGPPGFLGGGLGEIWKINPDGSSNMLAEFPGGRGPAGLAVDAAGNPYMRLSMACTGTVNLAAWRNFPAPRILSWPTGWHLISGATYM